MKMHIRWLVFVEEPSVDIKINWTKRIGNFFLGGGDLELCFRFHKEIHTYGVLWIAHAAIHQYLSFNIDGFYDKFMA